MTDVTQQGGGDATEKMVAEEVIPGVRSEGGAASVALRPSGAEGIRSKVHAVLEDQVQTDLTPELEVFLNTLLKRFTRNAHNIACHTLENKRKLEAKLRANPKKLAALKKMDELGGDPDLTEVDGEYFLFDDLARSLPASRRDVTYLQAVGRVAEIGGDATLTHPSRYLKLGNEMNIAMDAGNDRVWLYTALVDHYNLAFYGSWYNGAANVGSLNASTHDSNGAFRCSLKV